MLEPQTDPFERLTENYKGCPNLTLVNAAIAAADGIAPFYRVRRDVKVPSWAYETASFDRSHILRQKQYFPDIERYIEKIDVECVTFDTLFRRYGLGHVDLLQIDAEGYDAALLEMFDVATRRPEIVNFEHLNLSMRDWDRCISRLIDLGYRVAFGGWDTVAYLG